MKATYLLFIVFNHLSKGLYKSKEEIIMFLKYLIVYRNLNSLKEKIDEEFILFIVKAVLKRGNSTFEYERNSYLQ